MAAARILVIDDDRIALELYKSQLSSLRDIEFDFVSSGPEAILLAQTNDYCLVLLDLMMPGMNGFECAVALNKTFRRRTPIIFISAVNDSEQARRHCFEIGAVDYIVKPVSTSELTAKVKHFYLLDVNQNKLDASLKQIESQRNILQYSGEGILAYDKSLVITYANPAASILLLTTVDELIGCPLKQVMDRNISEDDWLQSDFVINIRQDQNSQAYAASFWRNDKDSFPVSYTQTTIFEHDKANGGVLVFQDTTEQLKLKDQLVQLATRDAVTGIMNRPTIYKQLSQRINNHEDHSPSFLLLLIDIDNFKSINDNFGHTYGDLLLVSVSKRLCDFVSAHDDIGRLGSDEFVILYTCDDNDELGALISSLIAELKKPFDLKGKIVYCTVSVGVARYPSQGIDAESLIIAADTAMYIAKQQGKDQFCFFNTSLQRQLNRNFQLSVHLRNTHYDEAFRLVYQPKYELKTMRVVGAEALLRWTSPVLGVVSPAEFIPIAENIGEINDITRWCLRSAVQDSLRWSEADEFKVPIKIAINASPIDLRQPDFVEMVLDAIYQDHLNPEWIEIEVTETAIMADPNKAIETLKRLRQHGVRISVDDFGTGYSSLNYLKMLPANYLKIDQSFVQNIGLDSSDEKIIRAIIQLAHSLDLKVIAEGIETKAHLEFLKELNCDYGQGYYLSKPQEKENIPSFFC